MTWTPSTAWVGPEGHVRVGNAAEIAARRAPEGVLHGWVDRLGAGGPLEDVGQVRLDPAGAPLDPYGELPETRERGLSRLHPADLLARLLHDPLRVSVLGLGARVGDVDRLVVGLVAPDGATQAGVAEMAAAVQAEARAVCPSADVEIRTVPRADAVRAASQHDGQERLLLLDVGAAAAVARVLGPDPAADVTLADPAAGGERWDTVLHDHLVSRGMLDPQAPKALESVRRAREALSEPGADDIALPAIDGRRPTLGRDELDGVLAPEIDRTVSLGRRALSAAGLTRPDRVLLAGGLAHTPALARAVTAAFDAPVARVADPDGATVQGARAALPAAATVDVDPADATQDDMGWWSTDGAQEHTDRSRLGIAAALAALVVGASVAAAALTGAFDRDSRVSAPTRTTVITTAPTEDVAVTSTASGTTTSDDSAATTGPEEDDVTSTSATSEATSTDATSSSTAPGAPVAPAPGPTATTPSQAPAPAPAPAPTPTQAPTQAPVPTQPPTTRPTPTQTWTPPPTTPPSEPTPTTDPTPTTTPTTDPTPPADPTPSPTPTTPGKGKGTGGGTGTPEPTSGTTTTG